ncbi:Rap1a/Tai family immunity protein [Methylobacterium sp. 17Sr1-1]|uniref:Rap1a/Tai family immunity protein n=1 Tax=Methylobacterium sp. 17Sr1-1 TaxID=2202826 RepID=UPI001FE0AF11|nr:Rap1a/Tai family immunity protein [Methylobacterium sp. 17Sr1-1]
MSIPSRVPSRPARFPNRAPSSGEILRLPHLLRSLALVAVLAAGTFPAPAHAAEGAVLVAQCKSLLRGAKVRGGEVEFRQDPETVGCWAFMGAVQDLAGVADSANQPPILGACLPPDGNRLQLVRAVVAYGAAHPPALRENAGVLALLALRDAFPCRKD